jgi:phosphate starvation-inducible PhoH-like protein
MAKQPRKAQQSASMNSAAVTQRVQGNQATTHRLKLKIDDLKTFDPLTENQRVFFEEYRDDRNMAFVLHGAAGTGKSFIALYKALETVMDPSNPYDGVVVVRSAVPGRDIGHLPGTEEEKLAVYEQPYISICHDLFGRADSYQRLKEQGVIEFLSSSYVRGITLDNKIVIVDEVQNYNFEELYTIATRVGHLTRIIFAGDFRQTDLRKRGDESGLVKFLDITSRVVGIAHVEYGVEDIVRSQFVKSIIIATMAYDDAH